MLSSDEELVRCYQTTGSRESLEELTRRHFARTRKLVASMVLNEAWADDVTQEVFLRMFRSLGSFDLRSRFSTWLYRIAMNTVYTHLERNGRGRVIFESTTAAAHEPVTPPQHEAEGAELEQEIAKALSALSPKLRAAIVLTCIEGLSTPEAARVEGCATATMYWRVHAARRELKSGLDRYLS